MVLWEAGVCQNLTIIHEKINVFCFMESLYSMYVASTMFRQTIYDN